MLTKAVTLALLIHGIAAQSSTTPSGTAPPILTATTAVPSPSASLDSPLPSQAALPPKQAWCPSDIFCAGAVSFRRLMLTIQTYSFLQLLQTVNVAHLYPDDKTFVDKVCPVMKERRTVRLINISFSSPRARAHSRSLMISKTFRRQPPMVKSSISSRLTSLAKASSLKHSRYQGSIRLHLS